VLYRLYSGGSTEWDVGSSDRLADCSSGGIYLMSSSNQGPTGGAPTAPGYSAGDGWYDNDNNGARGTISVSAGGGAPPPPPPPPPPSGGGH
jgi:hypothetical protein